jgi:preprotein translocase subunit SecG
MGIIGIVLLVIFVIVCVLLILVTLVQDEQGDSLGGIFAGSSSSTFGSRTGNVLTRFTGILGALFLGLALVLAFINRSGSTKGVEEAAREDNNVSATASANSLWYLATPTPVPTLAPSGSPELSPAPTSTSAGK